MTFDTFRCILSVAAFNLNLARRQIRGVDSIGHADPDQQTSETDQADFSIELFHLRPPFRLLFF